MMNFRVLIFILVSGLHAVSHAQVYKCKQPNGSTTYQSEPCPSDATSSVVDTTNRRSNMARPAEKPVAHQYQPPQPVESAVTSAASSREVAGAADRSGPVAPVEEAAGMRESPAVGVVSVLAGFAIYGLICSFMAGWARRQGRSYGKWFLLTFFFSPSVTFWLLFLLPRP